MKRVKLENNCVVFWSLNLLQDVLIGFFILFGHSCSEYVISMLLILMSFLTLFAAVQAF